MVSFARNIAVFGTASDVGKSVVATALCRLLGDAGFSVAPYKAQNMSNNAAVAHDGGEMGRAQYLQAIAARVAPSVHHNPILLKPTTERASQVIVRGRVSGSSLARDYFERGRELARVAFESLDRVMQQHPVVVLEGAGSCAEVNLRGREFVNFPAAHHAQARAVLVADIERGGVFAQVVGSLELMPPEDRARVSGILINKFRGDPQLFDDGVQFLESRTGVPVLGVVPYWPHLELDAEDSLNLKYASGTPNAPERIAVLCYPHIANFTDLDPLEQERVELRFLRQRVSLADYGVVILPGSKAVHSDLSWLRETGFDAELRRYLASGGKVLGICGGMQMLGNTLIDPHGVESSVRTTQGLGVLELTTELLREKTVGRRRGRLWTRRQDGAGYPIQGYEIHHGHSTHAYPPLLSLHSGDADGAPLADGVRTEQVWGTYLHGLFDAPELRHVFLRWAFPDFQAALDPRHRDDVLNAAIDGFARHLRKHVDWPRIASWVECVPA